MMMQALMTMMQAVTTTAHVLIAWMNHGTMSARAFAHMSHHHSVTALSVEVNGHNSAPSIPGI
jgi:hypothetical protein